MSLDAFRGQTLERHVEVMLKAWDEVKARYIPSIIRALKAYNIELDEKKADRLMRALIILHDTGKGAQIYQDHLHKGINLEGFRHELVSAYYARELLRQVFDDRTSFIGALTVMLHHEPILMGQISILDRDELSPEAALDKLRKFDGVVPELEPFLKEMFEKHLGIEIKVPEADLNAILRTIVELSVRARHIPDSNRMRLLVGALLIPLVLCDYRGAEEREGETPKFAKVLEAEWFVG
ncbi:CRISPR-associated endonuclease Cas3'' [Pyrococcus kukulkanii]|uniref:CRISPR-associated protein n=1 Tax=Pyrococcus kukulkanii TaxID=1609559 RepID=A0A127BA80_9EURY|nr:CRISPR-associated endonuclease Cas3'' [Pyrococcus kukulkanii]AMM53709.1 CRISPR-associated protein [Pyrococcus kukulkanii]